MNGLAGHQIRAKPTGVKFFVLNFPQRLLVVGRQDIVEDIRELLAG